MTAEQASAFKSVTEWVYLDHPNSSSSSSTTSALSSWVVDDFGDQKSLGRGMDKVVFELHSHSKHSDGFLSHSKLVEKAHGRGVILGNGVAPGRLHVARAMVEAGYVENLKQAFARYLYDGGPAYSTGSEPLAEAAVRLICETGGLAVLAHPWALKNPIPIIRQLKDAGLHGMEHGRGGNGESELGSVNLPVLVLHEFLKVARPIWCGAIKDILESYAKEPSALNLARIARFSRMDSLKGTSPLSCGKDWIDRCLSSWLTTEERQNAKFEDIRLKLSLASIDLGGVQVSIETK
ncbi:CAMP-regulated phosphoprotein 19-related protein isoform 1 [Hibiscus syriacus]|uniref:cAMP-regulated phosphoprotein 19-related protein isoform 1 n=1 Tax=Hibiscus syriacus TaxID=106335 RepID=A0A6A2XMJ0_HIBSY|nr:CAMP-regulated phosphoprotein 19-related protein isoform 1 [Hibiscus syriacus]